MAGQKNTSLKGKSGGQGTHTPVTDTEARPLTRVETSVQAAVPAGFQRTSNEGRVYSNNLLVLWEPSFLPRHLLVSVYDDAPPVREFFTLIPITETWAKHLEKEENRKRLVNVAIARYRKKLEDAMDGSLPMPWWQALTDEAARTEAHQQARRRGLQLANEANRHPGGVPAMSRKVAETFAKSVNVQNADIEYVEAAVSSEVTGTSNSAQASVPAPVTEDSPHFQEKLESRKQAKKRKKAQAKLELAQQEGEAATGSSTTNPTPADNEVTEARVTSPLEAPQLVQIEPSEPANTVVTEASDTAPLEVPLQVQVVPSEPADTEAAEASDTARPQVPLRVQVVPASTSVTEPHDTAPPKATLQVQVVPSEPADIEAAEASDTAPPQVPLRVQVVPASTSVTEPHDTAPPKATLQVQVVPSEPADIEAAEASDTAPPKAALHVQVVPSESAGNEETRASDTLEAAQLVPAVPSEPPVEQATVVDTQDVPTTAATESQDHTVSTTSPQPSIPSGERASSKDQPAQTQDTMNRKARADSVSFIRSRTNSRSGTNTPLIPSVRNTIQSLTESLGYLPSPLEIAENPLESETSAGEMAEPKGQDIIRSPPIEQKAWTAIVLEPLYPYDNIGYEEERRLLFPPYKPTDKGKGKATVGRGRGRATVGSGKGKAAESSSKGKVVESSGKGKIAESSGKGKAAESSGKGKAAESTAKAPEGKGKGKATAEDDSIVKPEPGAGETQMPQDPQIQDDSTATKPETLESQSKKKKKSGTKKRGGKKRTGPERIKKYFQAAQTSARLAHYQNPLSPTLRRVRRRANPTVGPSSMNPAMVGSPDTQVNRPDDSVPQLLPDNDAGFQALRWAYATHTQADEQLRKYNVFLFEKLPTQQAAPFQYPPPYDNLSELPPVIVHRNIVAGEAPAVHINGDPDWPGDSLMHVLPCAVIQPDQRMHPGHPDYLNPHLLREYQAVEIATGETPWRHDRELLDCSLPQCKKKLSDFNRETIVCLGCGPKTYVRYCSVRHLIEDLRNHSGDCGSDRVIIKRVFDENTEPARFKLLCPAIPNRRGYKHSDQWRQRTFAQLSTGQYTLFNKDKTENPTILRWLKTDPKHVEMTERTERVLNILFFENKNPILLRYFWQLMRALLKSYNQWTKENITTLGVQFHFEFDLKLDAAKNQAQREHYLRPLCEVDWDGDESHHVAGSECMKHFREHPHPCGDFKHAPGKGIKWLCEYYEAKYWILRAWRQRHPCPSWRQRAENTCNPKFPRVKQGREYPHPYLGEGFEGWGCADTDICEPWVYGDSE